MYLLLTLRLLVDFVDLTEHTPPTLIQSAKEGVRKPHRKIYEITLNRIGCGPEECIFLDDIGLNLKAARAMGINTIRVKNSPKGKITCKSLIVYDLTCS